MRKLVIAAVAGVVLAAGTTVALAASSPWPAVTVKPSVTPNKAGTPSHPQGVKLKATINWAALGSANQPIVTKFLLLFPKGARYNGGHTKTCPLKPLKNLGPSVCPKASIMGTGSGTAYADVDRTHPKITVVNGGANAVYFFTVLNNPARVQTPVIGHLTRVHGNFVYHLSATIPPILQVVAGVPIKLTDLHIMAGKGKWLEITSAPSGVKVVDTFDNGQTESTLVYLQDS